jgi:hypothetical protein
MSDELPLGAGFDTFSLRREEREKLKEESNMTSYSYKDTKIHFCDVIRND